MTMFCNHQHLELSNQGSPGTQEDTKLAGLSYGHRYYPKAIKTCIALMALNHQKDQNRLEREHPFKDQASHQQGIMNVPFLINERQCSCLGSQPLHKIIRLPKDLRKTLIGFFC